MKKKHLLTVLCLSTFIFGAQAQWPDTYQPRTVDKTNKDIATIDAAGNVIVAGTFTEGFSFGTTDLTPVASSTYAIKYSASGAKLGAVSIKGAATVTALTTDPTGNIYIAGNFADAVIFGSTDGNTQTKTGILGENSQPITAQGACFLAKYSPAGVLLKVETYVPQPLDIISDPDYKYRDLSFSISKLSFYKNKLIASVVMSGNTTNNSITLSGTYMDSWGFGFLFMNVFGGAIISINEDLQFSNIQLTLCPPTGEVANYDVSASQFDIRNDTLYAGFYTLGGKEVLTAGNNPIQIDFSNIEEGLYPYGILFASVDLNNGALISHNSSYAVKRESGLNFTLNSIYTTSDKLIISGTFKDYLFFNPALTSKGKDLYVTNLEKLQLSAVATTKSDLNEDETFASAAIYNDKLNIAYNDTAAKSSGIFSVSLTDGTGSAVPEATANTYTNSLFASNGKLVTVKATTSAVNTDLSTVSVSTADVTTPTGIRNPKAAAVSFYPNPVTSVIYLSAHGNIDVYNSLGILVKQAVAVDQLNVESLPAGIYFATVKAAGNITNIKFIKK